MRNSYLTNQRENKLRIIEFNCLTFTIKKKYEHHFLSLQDREKCQVLKTTNTS